MNKINSMWKAVPILAAFFVMGFCDIVGITSDYMQRCFQWSATMTGFIPSMVFIWFLFLSIPVGNQMNRWGRKNTVIASMCITVIGMFLPLIAFSSLTCIAAYILLGIGNAMMQVSLNPLLGNILSDNKMLTSGLTAGQVVKALSSLIGPEVVLLATSHFGDDYWYYCFPMLGVTTLLFTVWLWVTPIPQENKVSANVSINDSLCLLRNKRILLLVLGIFFIVGVDVATNFISSKWMTLNYDWLPEQAKYAPQTYFLCRTIGAFLGSFLLSRISSVHYFRISAIGCLISLLLLMSLSNATVSMVCIGGLGFFGSSIFSIIYGIAFDEYPSKMNQISGLIITAVAGGGVVTPILGMAVDYAGISAGAVVILCCVVYLIFSAFTIHSKVSH